MHARAYEQLAHGMMRSNGVNRTQKGRMRNSVEDVKPSSPSPRPSMAGRARSAIDPRVIGGDRRTGPPFPTPGPRTRTTPCLSPRRPRAFRGRRGRV